MRHSRRNCYLKHLGPSSPSSGSICVPDRLKTQFCYPNQTVPWTQDTGKISTSFEGPLVEDARGDSAMTPLRVFLSLTGNECDDDVHFSRQTSCLRVGSCDRSPLVVVSDNLWHVSGFRIPPPMASETQGLRRSPDRLTLTPYVRHRTITISI